MLAWNPQYATGSDKLDQQHQVIIDYINLLEELLTHPDPTELDLDFAVHLVDYLEAYANIHFHGEEMCMEKYRCRAHAENQREHERFRGYVGDYKQRCQQEGFQVEHLKELHVFMKTWINDHILKVDTQLRTCIPSSAWSSPSATPES